MLWQIIKKSLSLLKRDDNNVASHTSDQLIQNAIVRHQAGHLQEAEAVYQNILREQPENEDALQLLGLIAHQTGMNEIAVDLIEKAININPTVSEFYNNCGEAYRVLRKYDLAITRYEQALAIKPDYAEAHNNMGNALKDLGRIEEAITHYEESLAIMPDFVEAHYNMGIALQELGQQNEAINRYKQALAIKPDYAKAYNNMGMALQELGQQNEAISHYELAIKINPDYAEAHFNLAFVYLLVGNFKKGWIEYEWRHKLKVNIEHERNYSMPQWDGQPLNGKSILLHAEQGIGDVIQFVRYAHEISTTNSNIILACHKELHSLLSGMKGLSKIVGLDEEPDNYDFQCPLLSLPLKLNTTLNTIPNRIPYIKINRQYIDLWKKKFVTNKGILNVGIVWAGNPEFKRDRTRSPGLDVFKELFNLDDINFYSLQVGPGKDELCKSEYIDKVIDLTDNLNDFKDTAALMSGLDLIISSCTAPLHLAGALGLPTWAILSKSSDWRWMLDRNDTPWYPTMRLFRQQEIGNWGAVMNKIKQELMRLIAA